MSMQNDDMSMMEEMRGKSTGALMELALRRDLLRPQVQAALLTILNERGCIGDPEAGPAAFVLKYGLRRQPRDVS